jgi:hypothetical protein
VVDGNLEWNRHIGILLPDIIAPAASPAMRRIT